MSDNVIRIGYEPLGWAEPFHSGSWKHACLVGGLGSGKTYSALQELKACAIESPGFTWLIGRATLPSLRDTTMKSFFQVFEPGLIQSHNKARNDVTLVNGSEFIFRPLDDAEKFKSLEIAGFYVNEANEVSRNMYDTLKARVRQMVNKKPPVRFRTIIDLNPGDEDHWIPQIFLHEKPPGSELFVSTTMDNMRNLPEGYVDDLRRSYTPDAQQRMIYGLFGKIHQGRPVYPQFSRGSYVHPIERDPNLPIVRGWDFGYNRPAVVWLQMWHNQIRVLAELMGKEVYLDDFVKNEVRPYEKTIFPPVFDQKGSLIPTRFRDFCDPRGSDQSDKGKTSVQILTELDIRPAYRRTWIQEGLKVIKSRMDGKDETTGQPDLLVHPRCRTLIEGFRGGYVREDGEEDPKKDGFYEHLQDALRYAVIHCVQRSRINALMKSDETKVYIHPVSGRRIEY